MSSFKRRQPAPQVLQTPGTRLVPGSSSLLQISTGIPSLDDILGGGLPLGHVFTILAPDVHSAWQELLSRYFISQGLASGQAVCLVEDDPNIFLEGCMWLPGTSRSNESEAELEYGITQSEEHEGSHKDEKVKIAWRYEKMKQFRTTVDHDSSNCASVDSSASRTLSEQVDPADNYCQTFDLATKIPPGVLKSVTDAGQLTLIPVSNQGHASPLESILSSVAQVLDAPPRFVCITALLIPR
jgi:elongator complex protein 4